MLVAGSLRFCWFGCCGSLIVYWFVAGGFRFLRLRVCLCVAYLQAGWVVFVCGYICLLD